MNKTDTILKRKITDFSWIFFFSVFDLAKTSLYSVTFPSSPLTRNCLVKMFSFLLFVITRRSELEKKKNKENKFFSLTTFPRYSSFPSANFWLINKIHFSNPALQFLPCERLLK